MSSLSTIAPWQKEVERHLPKMSPAQARVLAEVSYAMMMTMHSGTTHVSHWLAKAKGSSANTVRQRVREWYYEASAKRGNKRREVQVEEHFADMLAWVLDGWEGEKRLVLVLDATTLGERWTILSISVVIRSCAIPVAWKVLGGHEKGSWRPHWKGLLKYLDGCIPAEWQVLVMADRGLYARWLFQAICTCGWHPFLRINLGVKARAVGEETFDWMVLSELKPHLGSESSFCYSSPDMKREREAKIDELPVLCCIYNQKASKENRTRLCNLLLLDMPTDL